jgi:hypothetical protein
MSEPPRQAAGDDQRLHNVRNHLSIIIGYCDLLLGDLPEHDPRYKDLLEVRKAATAAVTLLLDATGIR